METNDWVAVGTGLTAIATVALAIITGLLAWYAWRQISSAREEAKISRTLATCERYDLDPVLGPCVVRLRSVHKNGSFKEDPEPHYDDVISLLNYFESIGIGMDRQLYDVDIIRAHFSEIFQAHFNWYLGDDAPKVIKEKWFTQADYVRFKRLCENWSKGE